MAVALCCAFGVVGCTLCGGCVSLLLMVRYALLFALCALVRVRGTLLAQHRLPIFLLIAHSATAAGFEAAALQGVILVQRVAACCGSSVWNVVNPFYGTLWAFVHLRRLKCSVFSLKAAIDACLISKVGPARVSGALSSLADASTSG